MVTFTPTLERLDVLPKRHERHGSFAFTGSIKADDGSWTALCFDPKTGVMHQRVGESASNLQAAEDEMAVRVLERSLEGVY